MNRAVRNRKVVLAAFNLCKKCEQTVDCWLEEADKEERRQMQKELACRNENEGKNEVCEKSAPPEPTNIVCLCSSTRNLD